MPSLKVILRDVAVPVHTLLVWSQDGVIILVLICIYIYIYTGLLSKQGEKSIDFYFIMVPLRKKSIEVWYSKAQYTYIYIHIHIYTDMCVCACAQYLVCSQNELGQSSRTSDSVGMSECGTVPFAS